MNVNEKVSLAVLARIQDWKHRTRVSNRGELYYECSEPDINGNSEFYVPQEIFDSMIYSIARTIPEADPRFILDKVRASILLYWTTPNEIAKHLLELHTGKVAE